MECFDIKYWIRLPRFWLSLSKKNDKKIPADKCDNQCCKWIHPKYSNALRGALAVGRKIGSAIALQRAWKLLHLIKRSLICNYKESKKPFSHYYLILLAPWCVCSQIWWDKYARITRASRAIHEAAHALHQALLQLVINVLWHRLMHLSCTCRDVKKCSLCQALRYNNNLRYIFGR